MADNLRADLDQLLCQTRQRPILDRHRRRQRAQEITEIIEGIAALRGTSPQTAVYTL